MLYLSFGRRRQKCPHFAGSARSRVRKYGERAQSRQCAGRACEGTATARTSRQCAGRAREGTINARTPRQCAGRTLEGTVARGRTFAVAARTDAAEPARGYGRLDCTRQRGRAACNPKLAS